jgi:hypothetical protein
VVMVHFVWPETVILTFKYLDLYSWKELLKLMKCSVDYDLCRTGNEVFISNIFNL